MKLPHVSYYQFLLQINDLIRFHLTYQEKYLLPNKTVCISNLTKYVAPILLT